MSNYSVLVVEDERDIAIALEAYLLNQGYKVLLAQNGVEGLKAIKENEIHLAIVDVMMPKMDGITFTMKLREEYYFPVIMLSAKSEDIDKIMGLNIGADDYITKPFSVKELLARVNRIIVRNKNNEKIKVQEITFDIDKMEVYKNNELLSFTSLELKILYLLFTNLNKVVTRNYIIDSIWEWTGNDVNDNTVTVYLKRIREKLKSDIIITIKGIGYRIDEETK